MREILVGHGDDGPPAPGQPDVVGPYLRHLLDHHRVLVAEERGTVLAFGAVVDTGRCLMLSDLFVRRERLGEGHGRRLLGVLFESAPRRATFASSDPRALPLYVRAGMTPRWINLYLEGPAAALPVMPAAFAARRASPAECTDLELAWMGADRSADHQFLAALPDADTFVVEEDGSPVALGQARRKAAPDARVLERLVVRPDVDPLAPILAGLRRAAGGGRIEACVPGPNPVLPRLLEARFRIVDQDQFLASDGDIADPAHLLPNGGLL
jgi:GNAT superfamily N-acetyltransferase